MLTRKSASNGVEFDDDTATQVHHYELTTKQYDSTRQKILYQDSSNHTLTEIHQVNNTIVDLLHK